MKKIVYVIITLLAFTLLIDLNSGGNEKTLKVINENGVVEFNPIY